MRSLYFLSVWLHILAAATWVGGMMALAFVVIPALRDPELQPVRAKALHLMGLRLRVVGWVSLAVLLVTGLYNVAAHGFGLSDAFTGVLWKGAFGRTLAEKLSTFVVLVLLNAAHDFWVGPKVTALALRSGNPSAEGEKWRKAALWLGRLVFLLSLWMVALGIMLVRGRPF